MATTDLDRMLTKVQGLLRQADHPNTGPTEAQTFRAKAEALMMRYRIDEAMLAQAPDSGVKPKWGEFLVCAYGSEYRYYYRYLAEAVLEHCGVRGVVEYVRGDGPNDDGSWASELRCDFVGFESDLRLVRILYTECMLAFQSRLEPGYDANLSPQINAYRMRRAGMEWNRICEALFGPGTGEHRFRLRARRMFLKESDLQGTDPSPSLGMGTNMRVFRESYSNGFYSELASRLRRMRSSRWNTADTVLAGRTEAIDIAFYERYPQYAPPKPLPEGTDPDAGDAESEEGGGSGSVAKSHARGTYVDPRSACSKCQKAKSGYCRDHAYMRPSSARTTYRAFNYEADSLGRSAARRVDLGSEAGGRSLS